MKLKLCVVACIILLVLTSSRSEAQITNDFTPFFYTDTGDHKFETDANWSEDFVPFDKDTSVSTGPGTTLLINQGSDEFEFALSLSQVTIGVQGPRSLTGGDQGGGIVDYTIASGSTLTLQFEGALEAVQADYSAFDVSQGTTANFSGGTIAMTAGNARIGDSAGSGTLNLSGTTFEYTTGFQDGNLFIIGAGNTGVVNLNNNSSLTSAGALTQATVIIGSGISPTQSGTGILNINPGGTFEAGENTDVQLGQVTKLTAFDAPTPPVPQGTKGGFGIINQQGGNAVFEFNSTAELGDYNGGTGTYNLSNGTLTIENSSFKVGAVDGAKGAINQTGGIMTIDNGSFVVGAASGATGDLNVSGGTLTATNAIIIGGGGQGNFLLSGSGHVTVNGGIIVGQSGNSADGITQTGGVLTVSPGSSITLSQANSSYKLDAGTALIGGEITNSLASIGIIGPGSFSMGGGTLQLSSDLAVEKNVALTGGDSTFDITNGNATIDAVLSGPGGLIVAGTKNDTTNSFNLNTAATYEGGTEVKGGLLNATLATLPTTGPLTIDAGGTVDLGHSGVTTLGGSLRGGSITGPTDSRGALIGGTLHPGGTLNVTDPTLILASTANFIGTLNLPDTGALQVPSGILSGITGTNLNVTVGGAASGGTLNLVGANNFTGTLTIDNKYKVFAKNLPMADVVNFGTLGSNAIFPTAPGTPTVSLNSLNSSGTLIVRTDFTSGSSDVYSVANTANLSGIINLAGTGVGTKNYSGIVRAGLLTLDHTKLNTTAPGGLHVITNSPLLIGMLEANATTLDLTTMQGATLPFARTPNQMAAARAIDPVRNNPPANFTAALTGLNQLTAAQIPAALDQLTPEIYAYQREIAFENSTFLVQQMDHTMTNLHYGYGGLDTSGLNFISPGFSSSMGQSLLAFNQAPAPGYGAPADYDPTKPLSAPGSISDQSQPDVEPSPGFNPRPPPPGVNFSEFISGSVILAELNQNHGSGNSASPDHASYTAGDITAGVAYKITAHLSTGVLFNYNHTDARVGNQGSRIKVDSFTPGGFLTFAEKGFYANGLFTFGYNSYSDEHHQAFGGFAQRGSSKPNGEQYTGNLDFGYNFHPDHPKQWTMGPELGATFTHLDVDQFSETGGGGTDLNVHRQSADSLRSRLGASVSYRIASGYVSFEPTFSAMWQHEFLDDPSSITANLAAPGTGPLTINTSAPSRDSALLSLGLQATIRNTMVLYFNYLADVSPGDFFVQGFQGGLKTSF